ncbi:MAG: hypothetical protein ACKVOJ_00960 [Sphingomonadaceae bacterium]
MHRVRVGLTGLAAVGLLVLLVTFVVSRIGIGTPAAKQAVTAKTPSDKTKDQPLAELGIAPSTPANSNK